jgi:hypothetical protein
VVNSTRTNPGGRPLLSSEPARSRSGRMFNGIKSLGPRIRFPATWTTLSATVPIFMRLCASLSAYRGAAVLFKLLDVSVAAAQPVPRLLGGFCCAAGFNAHGAERNGGTAIEWCAHCLAIALPVCSRAANGPGSQIIGGKSDEVDVLTTTIRQLLWCRTTPGCVIAPCAILRLSTPNSGCCWRFGLRRCCRV